MRLIASQKPEPHARRRAAILRAVPAVYSEFGVEWRTKYIGVALAAAQVAIAVGVRDFPWPLWLACAYLVGATASQTLFLVNHETAHDLASTSRAANCALGIAVNLPSVFPYSAAFRHYHLMHHKHLGTPELDVDVPTARECRVMRTFLGRCIWLTFQIVAYAVRPLVVHPLSMHCDMVVNATAQIAFDACLLRAYGPQPFAYLLLSMLISGGWHPCAMHFLAEHTHFTPQAPAKDDAPEVDTFDMSGFSAFTLNVHHHRVHHDFSKVPWSRLPRVQRLAAPYYPGVGRYWWEVLWDFLCGRGARVVRRPKGL